MCSVSEVVNTVPFQGTDAQFNSGTEYSIEEWCNWFNTSHFDCEDLGVRIPLPQQKLLIKSL